MSTVKCFIKVKWIKAQINYLQIFHMKLSSMTLIGQHHEEDEACTDIFLVLMVLVHHQNIVWPWPHQRIREKIVINILFQFVSISRVAAWSQQTCVGLALMKMKMTNTTFAAGGLVEIVGLSTYNWNMGSIWLQISNLHIHINSGSMRQGDHFSQTKKKVGETGN